MAMASRADHADHASRAGHAGRVHHRRYSRDVKRDVHDADQLDELDPLTGDDLNDTRQPPPRWPSKWWLLALTTVLILAYWSATSTASATTGNSRSIDGQSPHWYPTPRGGTSKQWQASYAKAAHLVRQMTLVEKVNLTTGTGWMMGLCVGNTGPVARLGFPSLCLQDGPIALRFADRVTAGPAGITVGATFNTDLMYKRGRMMGLEARAKGVNVVLGPAVGALGRSPLGGRNWEGFGSDPVLQGVAAAATIRGIQDQGVMATIKHFVGNEQEHFRQVYEWGLPVALSSNMDDRTLHELYAWPFADAVRAGVASVMCAYQQVNNSYACQNSKLLNGVLKDELGFQGFVQSDWLAQRSGVAAALAGLDMSMPGDGERWMDGAPFWGHHLTAAVLNASVPLPRLDDMATRIVAAWFQLGQDNENDWPRDGGPNFSSWTDEPVGLLRPGSDDTATGTVNRFVDAQDTGGFSHSSLARRLAAEGTVLLKNDHDTLPFARNGRSQAAQLANPATPPRKLRIGIYGEDAVVPPKGPNSCPDRSCNKGTLAMGWGSGAVEFPYLVAPADALKQALDADAVDISTHPHNTLPDRGAALADLKRQDTCIVFANADAGEGYLAWQDIHGDRNDLRLQQGSEELVVHVAQHCGTALRDRIDSSTPQVVVVIHAVGPVLLEPFIDLPSVGAVLVAHLPGQESGAALADILFGNVNPSGHLPYTIGKTLADYGPSAPILRKANARVPQQDFTEGPLIDYRWFDAHGIAPRYAFGHGLSYTTFAIRNLLVEPMLPARPAPLPPPHPAPACTPPAYATTLPNPADALFPTPFRRLHKYIYPYLDRPPAAPLPAPSPSPAPLSPAGGGQGGHPDLWTVLVRVHMTVANTGLRSGQAVPQLYVVFPQDTPAPVPRRVLRAFAKLHLDGAAVSRAAQAVGESAVVTLELTRRDLSYWCVERQNWVLPEGSFGIEVGFGLGDIRARDSVF